MSSDTQLLDNVNSLLDDLAEALEERLNASVEENGIEGTCSHCVATQMADECSTALLSDLYAIGKSDPGLLLSVLVKTLMNATALQALLQRMIEQSYHLFEDDLPEGDDED
jgi:hypothetical protein